MPVSAALKIPLFAVDAPVKAPFSCPKSIASNMFSGIAAQFMPTKGPDFLLDRSCTNRDNTSFPVPVGPLIKTVTSALATRSAIFKRL